MARCLVTGHMGYIGSHVYDSLINLGHEVKGIDLKENQNTLPTKQEESTLQKQDDLVSGVSLENAAYFENDLSHEQSDQKKEPEETVIDEISLYEEKPLDIPEENPLDEFSPQLFSDEETLNASSESNIEEPLKSEEEEDFEIPAFLRKQKF